MPTINHITVLPNTGSGRKTVSISAETHTGREPRSATFKLYGTGDYSSIQGSNSLIVTQKKKDAFITLSTSSNTSAFSSDGGQITWSGTSNLASITMNSGTLASCFSSSSINGVSVTKTSLQSGYTVTGDPGASAQFNVSFTFTIPENTSSTSTVTYTCSIGGQTISVTQAAAGVSLSYSVNSATATAEGGLDSPSTVTVNATSGLNWTITKLNN